MVSTLTKKAWNDLSRRKARTVFTIVTVALAVGSLGLLFVSPMMDNAMMKEVEAGRLHNIRYLLVNADLNESDVEAIAALHNIQGVEAHTFFMTEVKVGQRTCKAVIIGLDSFSGQEVDRVILAGGRAPGAFGALVDILNGKYTEFSAGEGAVAHVLDASGREVALNITGSGRSLEFSSYTQWVGAVFYTTSETVRSLAGPAASTFLDIDLRDDSDGAMKSATASVESTLAKVEPGAVMRATPELVPDEKWPGKEGFQNMMMGFSIITWLALITGVVLISNTMNTTMLEQTREIGCLKAVGASRGQVARVYLSMAAMIGVIGSALGIALGVVIANLMVQNLGPIFAISPGIDVYLPGLLISFLAGVGVSVAAAGPALWRGMRLGTREALDDNTKGYAGTGRVLRVLTGSRKVPRTVQMGSRNVGRNTGRSAATVLQLALAVGTVLCVASIGASIQVAIETAFDDERYELDITSQGGMGSMDPSVGEHIMEVPGVKLAEPYAISNFRLAGDGVAAYGLLLDSRTHAVRISDGRWFTPDEANQSRLVAVISTTMARNKGIAVGDDVKMMTAAGERVFRVVGVMDTIFNMGRLVVVPMPTLQSLLGMGHNVSGFAVQLDKKDTRSVDAAALGIQKALKEAGHMVEIKVMYVLERQNIQGINDVMIMIQGLGLIIVLISMVGLANNLTMNVLERTREIGMMRCIGASAGSIRSVFSSEGAVLMLAGWAIGIPLGYALGFGFFQMFLDSLAISMPFAFPVFWVLVALVLVVGAGALIIQVPITRAVRIPPGDALRYQ
jgi:putative ABC transport system permease protein